MTTKSLITIAINAAIDAGKAIMDIYQSDFTVDFKSDLSPITLADQEAHNIIKDQLSKTRITILSEEGKDIPYIERKDLKQLWIVDPLDGTKEFVNHNGEFTVNIALWQDNTLQGGVIFCPVKKELFFASIEDGAYYIQLTDFNYPSVPFATDNRIKADKEKEKLIILASRSHNSVETVDFIDSLKQENSNTETSNIGSSLKFCLLAQSKAHIYPRFGKTMEWDTAAGQAILEIAGGKVLQTEDSKPMIYNKPSLVNPNFIAYSPK